QPLGSGLGHAGSTSNRGACTAPFACASAVFCSRVEPAPSATTKATSVSPTERFRFIASLTTINAETAEHAEPMISLRVQRILRCTSLSPHPLLNAFSVMLLALVHVAA